MRAIPRSGLTDAFKASLKKPVAYVMFRLPAPARKFLYRPAVRKVVGKIPLIRVVYIGWAYRHPMDVAYGTDTSGFVDTEQLQHDRSLVAKLNPYMGSQPSLIRAALQALPSHAGATFIDLGCGKGRGLIVAAEFPFKRVVGVDISSELVSIARDNARRLAARFPERVPMCPEQGNAAQFVFPAGEAVLFMYNPFGAELLEQVLRNIERALAGSLEHIFVVYMDPLYWEIFDGSTELVRYFADRLPYAGSELAYGPDVEESVVIWQSKRNARPSPHAGRERRVAVKVPGWIAEVLD